MQTFGQLPLELFYQIALHLPLTKDVLAFSLTNSRIRKALSTPALFKDVYCSQGTFPSYFLFFPLKYPAPPKSMSCQTQIQTRT